MYYYRIGTKIIGPVSLDELRAHTNNTSWVRKDGEGWKKAGQLSEYEVIVTPKQSIPVYHTPMQSSTNKGAQKLKACPYCKEDIKLSATYCRFCNHDLSVTRNLVSTGSSALSIAGGCVSKVLTFGIVLAILLFLTNPKEVDLKEKLKSEGLLNIHQIYRDDLVLFSAYAVRSMGTNGLKERVYIGALNNFILVSEE